MTSILDEVLLRQVNWDRREDVTYAQTMPQFGQGQPRRTIKPQVSQGTTSWLSWFVRIFAILGAIGMSLELLSICFEKYTPLVMDEVRIRWARRSRRSAGQSLNPSRPMFNIRYRTCNQDQTFSGTKVWMLFYLNPVIRALGETPT